MEKPKFTVCGRTSAGITLEIHDMRYYGDSWLAAVRDEYGKYLLRLDKNTYIISPSGRKYGYDDFRFFAESTLENYRTESAIDTQ